MTTSTHDNTGRPWAKLSECKIGDKLETDGGFTCLPSGEIKTVYLDPSGALAIRCDKGDHAIATQAYDGDHLVGLYKVSHTPFLIIPKYIRLVYEDRALLRVDRTGAETIDYQLNDTQLWSLVGQGQKIVWTYFNISRPEGQR